MVTGKHITTPPTGLPELSEREEIVLRSIVQHFILTATPVGSRFLSKRLEEESLSAATIRNVMADLEEKGFITHPHTSAGRIPTDRGYRIYVNGLVRSEKLTRAELSAIKLQIDPSAPTPVMMRQTSKLIGAISQQLGVVMAPEILDAILGRLELVPLSSTRLLVVLSLQAGLVRTITLEINEEVSREGLEALVETLNRRLSGLTLREIRTTFRDRLSDLAETHPGGLVRIFLDSADTIFAQANDQRVHISPTRDILLQPEFSTPEQFRGIVELIENEEVIVHLLEGRQGEEQTVEVMIGHELGDERMAAYSLIATRYCIGDATGTIGLIGPKRMNYSRMITVVEYVAKTITNNFHER